VPLGEADGVGEALLAGVFDGVTVGAAVGLIVGVPVLTIGVGDADGRGGVGVEPCPFLPPHPVNRAAAVSSRAPVLTRLFICLSSWKFVIIRISRKCLLLYRLLFNR
jgi:hypothetical protein